MGSFPPASRLFQCSDSNRLIFTFSAVSGPGNTATVRIDVYNNAPVATDASYSILHDRTLTRQVYGYDRDGDPITAHLVNDATHGTVAPNPDGTFSYTPDVGYVGWDYFTYQWSDGVSMSNTGTLFISVRDHIYRFTDLVGNTWQFVLSDAGQLSRVIDPLGHACSYTYNTAGQLVTYTDRLGRSVTFGYDDDSRLVNLVWLEADETTVVDTMSFAYSPEGYLVSASNLVGSYSFSWDNGVLSAVTNPWGVTLTFGYDAEGQRVTVGDSFGEEIHSVYIEGSLRSRTLTAEGVRLRVDWSYDSDNALTQIHRYLGTTPQLVAQSEYRYSQGTLDSISHRDLEGVILEQLLYQYDATGLPTRISSQLAGQGRGLRGLRITLMMLWAIVWAMLI